MKNIALVLPILLILASSMVFAANIEGIVYDIELNTRLDQLYASIKKNDVAVVYNRICQNKNVIARNFMFVDLNASSDPTYDQLTTRYILLWSDEFN